MLTRGVGQAGSRPGDRRRHAAWSSSCSRWARRRPRCSSKGVAVRDRLDHAQQPARDRSGGEVRQLSQQRARAGRGAAHERRLRGDPVRRRRQHRRGGEQQRVRGRAAARSGRRRPTSGILDGITRAQGACELCRAAPASRSSSGASQPDELRARRRGVPDQRHARRPAGHHASTSSLSATGCPGRSPGA